MNDTIGALRAKTQRRTFMEGVELRRTRKELLRCSQAALATQLLNPASGQPINDAMVSKWERGERPVPLWVARHVRLLAESARRYDTKED